MKVVEDYQCYQRQTGCQRWQMKIIKMAIKFTSNCCKFSTSGGTWVSLFLLRSIVVLPKAEAVFISFSTAPSTASPTAMLIWRLVSCQGYIVCLSRPRFCAPRARVGSLRSRRLEVVGTSRSPSLMAQEKTGARGRHAPVFSCAHYLYFRWSISMK